MNPYTKKALKAIDLGHIPLIPCHVKEGGVQRTSKRVIQSFLANNVTYLREGNIYSIHFNHIALGVYEFTMERQMAGRIDEKGESQDD